MKRWSEYLEEAKKTLLVEETRREVRALLTQLQEAGLIELLEERETLDFPYIQIDVKTPISGVLRKALHVDIPCTCTVQDVYHYLWEIKFVPEVVHHAFLLFVKEVGIERFRVYSPDPQNTNLFYEVGTFHTPEGTRRVFLWVHNTWIPSSCIEEEDIQEEEVC